MDLDTIKDSLRQVINASIKGEDSAETEKMMHDVLQAKMQEKITAIQNKKEED